MCAKLAVSPSQAHSEREESAVEITTVGVDLAKNCFQLAEADGHYRICRRERLTRARFSHWMSNHPQCRVVMEACGSAHHWARVLRGYGHEVTLLPAQHVRAYVRRNKTDAADAAALIEASRCEDIKPVAVKSVEQQVLQQLHRLRTQWQGARKARINSLRGLLREFGVDVPMGATRGIAAIREALELADNGVPDALRPFIEQVLEEITELALKVKGVDRSLRDLTRDDPTVQRLEQTPGVGLIVATAMRAAIADIHRFPSGRHLSSWLGVTAQEHSSGERRRLGRISKRGDVYLRTQLIHGARAALLAAKRAAGNGLELDRLRRWALETEQRVGHNKATVALANKLARIIWATWKYERNFDGNWKHPAAASDHSA
jgi:transposase